MASKVFFGTARQARLEAKETLPAKLDLILDQLHLRDRVDKETVVIKMHTGNNMVYSTIHPVFVQRVVQAIKDGGGKPFVVDVNWDTHQAEKRGYSTEVLGCPVYPAAGPEEKYFYEHERPYKSIQSWKVAGLIQDSSFLVNFAHVKGHPSCGFGAAFKNLALGCMAGRTRGAMHDVMHYDQYWFPEKCDDKSLMAEIVAACPHNGVVVDKDNPENLHMHFEECNQCGRCLHVAPEGSLRIQAVNFHSFQEACAHAVDIVLSTFELGKAVHLNLASHMTPVCDCFGFTSMPILPDAGVFGSDDIVALDTATLDVIAKTRLIEDNIPTSMEVHTREGHPFQWLHGPFKDPYKVTEFGEKLGIGSREYELVDVLPLEFPERKSLTYIAAHA
jgi:uncharacterized Fe-S center protein